MGLMPAGEEMDRLVAEKAMGWEYLVVGYFPYDPNDTADVDPDYNPRQEELKDWLDEVGLESVGHFYINVKKNYWRGADSWQPSKRVSQALKAIERHCDYYSITKDGMYYCSIAPNTPKQITVVGKTMALAICRALLDYLGVKVTDY